MCWCCYDYDNWFFDCSFDIGVGCLVFIGGGVCDCSYFDWDFIGDGVVLGGVCDVGRNGFEDSVL